MRELRTEIEIAAPLTKVWSILTDFENWKEWNPIVDQVSGIPSLGSVLRITMCGSGSNAGKKYKAVVTHIKEPRSFRWRAKMIAGFLFTNDKTFELEEIGSGTRLIHREGFSGVLVPLFWDKLNNDALPMLKSMNNALKKVAEKSSDYLQ